MGQNYTFLNGGPDFPFNAQVSLYVLCDGQAEVDHYWDALMAGGGAPQQCGWLSDRFGLSWQVIPVQLEQLMDGSDPGRTQRAVERVLDDGLQADVLDEAAGETQRTRSEDEPASRVVVVRHVSGRCPIGLSIGPASQHLQVARPGAAIVSLPGCHDQTGGGG